MIFRGVLLVVVIFQVAISELNIRQIRKILRDIERIDRKKARDDKYPNGPSATDNPMDDAMDDWYESTDNPMDNKDRPTGPDTDNNRQTGNRDERYYLRANPTGNYDRRPGNLNYDKYRDEYPNRGTTGLPPSDDDSRFPSQTRYPENDRYEPGVTTGNNNHRAGSRSPLSNDRTTGEWDDKYRPTRYPRDRYNRPASNSNDGYRPSDVDDEYPNDGTTGLPPSDDDRGTGYPVNDRYGRKG